MSRDYGARMAAWEVWIYLHSKDGQKPRAFEHHCGALTGLGRDNLGSVVCSGCGYELARPESECMPLYLAPSPEGCDCVPVRSMADDELTWVPGVRPCRLHPRKVDFGPERGEWLQTDQRITDLPDYSAALVAFEWVRLESTTAGAVREAFEAHQDPEQRGLGGILAGLKENLDLIRWHRVPTNG